MKKVEDNANWEEGRREQDAELYLETRKGYNVAEAKAEEGYDKWLLTLSGGALGLSMTFLKEISQHGVVEHRGSLIVAWILLAASIVCILANMRICPHLQDKYRKILDHQFSRDVYDPAIDNMGMVAVVQAKVKLTRIIDVLNWASLALFFVGIVLIARFTSSNLH
jgi:hypothetical protein